MKCVLAVLLASGVSDSVKPSDRFLKLLLYIKKISLEPDINCCYSLSKGGVPKDRTCIETYSEGPLCLTWRRVY